MNYTASPLNIKNIDWKHENIDLEHQEILTANMETFYENRH